MACKRRDERGATAVLVAVLALVLFVAGAIAMDMGQIYAKRSALQSNVDMAVLAAAAEIDGSATCTPEAVAAATDYLTKDGNSVDGQITVDLGGTQTDDDGFINCDGWRVELWAPKAHTEFGMGKVAGVDGVDVPAFAAAEIKAANVAHSLPMYAVEGCHLGHQEISNPPPSGSNPHQPPNDLDPDSQAPNNASFTLSASEVDVGTVAFDLTITGSNLTGVTEVGFTQAGAAPNPNHHTVTVTPDATGTQIGPFAVPAQVLATPGLWWVRVYKPPNATQTGRWSAGQNGILPFEVGQLLFCDGAISGNFGTLRLARSDVNNGSWLSWNIIKGIQPTLAVHPTPPECDDSDGDSVVSDHSPNNGTNCLDTDPGFPNEELTDGLITGSSGLPGRLDKPTTGNCSRDGDGDEISVPTNPAKSINDDVLTCFIVDGSSIQDVVNGTPEILSADILDSPRFFTLPVIPTEATQGTSNWYPILYFQPGFITGQPTSATNAAPGDPGVYNGLGFHSNHVESLQVILFPPTSLPEFAPAVGGEGEYTGTGPKVIVLVE